jgi:ribosome-binding protein aMBF1 (putative translation factor)
MTAPTILTAIRMGESVLRKKHVALDLLWRKFGHEIRTQRKTRRMTLAMLAHKLGFSTQMVIYLERGERNWPKDSPEKAISILKLKRPAQWPDAGRG